MGVLILNVFSCFSIAATVGLNFHALLAKHDGYGSFQETELMHTVATAATRYEKRSGFRYSRGNGIGATTPPNSKDHTIRVWKRRSFEGTRPLEALGILTTVADARFCKPLDKDLLRKGARER